MPTTTWSLIYGPFIVAISTASITLNIFVLYIFIKARLISKNASSFYLLSFVNMFASAIYDLPFLFYLAPASILQEKLVSNEIFKAIGCFCLTMWGQNQFMQVLIAVNRLLVVMYPKSQHFFTFNNTVTLSVVTFLLGFIMAFITQYNGSCCSYSLYYKTFSALFLGDDFNVNSLLIYMPFNIICSFIAITCYITLFIYVKTSNAKTVTCISKNYLIQRKAREQRYAFQFSLCTICCLISWVTVRILGFTLESKNSKFYIIATVFLTLHMASNALVLLFFNTDVQENLKRIFFKHYTSKTTLSIIPYSGKRQRTA